MIRVDAPATWALRSLESVLLNTGFARVVLEGQVEGRLWIDRFDSPRVLHALHPYGMSLVWGDAVADGFEQIINHLRDGEYRTRDEWLQIDPRWKALDWDQRLDATDAATASDSTSCSRHTRVNFGFDAERFQQLVRGHALPDGWRLRQADAGDFELPGQVVPNCFWHDAEQFLAAGSGWCAEQAGNVGAIAFASYRWGGEVEIGIETFEHARRQGLGHAVAARMIVHVLQAGFRPVWSCRLENTASCALAHKLGFLPLRNLPYYRLSPRNEAA
ncbi:hypothetical protein CLG96_16645 [Sphingomonas oleivorans]|uniref:N-acetyltransferase domain-containing protein n=1 Tax=Sphingomonas oleivorans TaxID=1735121 RepID=A0A2T5FU16_9SPHN|nr:GNAT family N-acetyltransferase [Sphingomonas oleivorans]PTQ07779.1 hypothetical protein CLG96_16645 [Sphingomonas oleivorans]